MKLTLGLLIPFLGTTLGSGMVFLMKNKMNKMLEKLLLGFASGVMIAASVWSLLIPSIDMAESQGKNAWIPAAIGFLLGMIFLLILDSIIPHLHLNNDKPTKWKIENSWGDEHANKGYYVATDSWFDKFVYQAVINKKYLNDNEIKDLEKEPKKLELWDPMGTLA